MHDISDIILPLYHGLLLQNVSIGPQYCSSNYLNLGSGQPPRVPDFTVVPKFRYLPLQRAPKCEYWATVLQQYLNLGSSQHSQMDFTVVPKFLASSCLIFRTSNNFAFIWTKNYSCLYMFDSHGYLIVNILSSVGHLHLISTTMQCRGCNSELPWHSNSTHCLIFQAVMLKGGHRV